MRILSLQISGRSSGSSTWSSRPAPSTWARYSSAISRPITRTSVGPGRMSTFSILLLAYATRSSISSSDDSMLEQTRVTLASCSSVSSPFNPWARRSAWPSAAPSGFLRS